MQRVVRMLAVGGPAKGDRLAEQRLRLRVHPEIPVHVPQQVGTTQRLVVTLGAAVRRMRLKDKRPRLVKQALLHQRLAEKRLRLADGGMRLVAVQLALES